MGKKQQNVYMPLMMGDWLRGTQGMKAEARGVYINLLIHQYDHGFIPSDLAALTLIDPEVGSVWVSLIDKFPEVSPGRRQNQKLESVRNFWNKQRKNGQKGGRAKYKNPNANPNTNPDQTQKATQSGSFIYDPDYDSDINILKEYQQWTAQILDGNDHDFNVMFQNAMIEAGDHIPLIVADHLDLLNRYPKMRPPNQQAFRQSCLKHIRENQKKFLSDGSTKKQQQIKSARDFLAKYYGAKPDSK